MALPQRFLWCLVVSIAVALSVPAGAQLEPCSWRLSESTPAHELWTCPPSAKVFRDSPVPALEQSGVQVHAARNEFEPFVVVVRPSASGSVTFSMGDFGAGITQLAYQVKYVTVTTATDMRGSGGDHPDPLWPLENGATVSLVAGQNTAFWVTVHVPPATPPGDYSANFTVAGINVPVTLHVFDFQLPGELSIASAMNYSQQEVLSKYGAGFSDWAFIDRWKQFMIDHRLTPLASLWPDGLTSGGGDPLVNYDCGTRTLSDPYGIWGFEQPAARWIGGSGLMGSTFTAAFNDGAGFPSFQAIGLGTWDPSQDPRPGSVCGVTRSAADWYLADDPASAFNQEWFSYIGALRDYLDGLGYLDRAYYFLGNEPYYASDYDAIAWHSALVKAAAPDLRVMVAEEPKPELFDHPDYVAGGQVDIWLTYLGAFNPAVASAREAIHGEESWVYYLPGVVAPYFNPFTLDHPGLDSRLLGWFLWKYRLRGFAHDTTIDWFTNPWTTPAPTANNGFTNLLYPPSESNTAIVYGSNGHRPVPSIRLELIRDGLEDYEYLRVLNAAALPAAGVANAADAQVDKVIGGLASYVQDPEFVCNLRRLVGRLNGGEIAELPDIQPAPTHQRAYGAPGDWYLNFQDPLGQPLADPLVVDGKEYLKVGGAAYDAGAGLGWYAPPSVFWQYAWVSYADNDLQRSVLYSDYGKPAVFEFDLPAGQYDVTVSVGWPNRADPHGRIVVEGVPLVDDELVTGNLVRTATVTIADSRLTMEMGVDGYYTMLNYLDIEAHAASPVPGGDLPAPGARHQLHDAAPNPFNPATRLAFTLAGPERATLRLYDLSGRLVRTLLADSALEAGRHEVAWDGTDDGGRSVAAGVYLCRLEAGTFRSVKAVSLVK